MSKREHVLEICDQTVQCTVCLHVDWMEDSLPEECPGPPQITITHQISNEGQKVHFNHPRLGIRCACPECQK